MRLLLFVGIVLGIQSHALVPKGGEDPCEPIEQLGREFVDLELAGARWQGGDSPCLPALKVKMWKADALQGIEDPSLLDPDLILPDQHRVEIQVKRLPDDLLQVRYSYVASKGKADVAVQDEVRLKLNFGKARKKKGCASMIKAPQHFVMKQSCVSE